MDSCEQTEADTKITAYLMAPPKSSSSKSNRNDIIRSITTPLGFFVLALLIIEATLAIVLSCSKLSEDHVWDGFCWMLVTFACVVIAVSVFAWRKPKNLLYGKEEHASDALTPSALRDQIEDIVAERVKPESLNPPKN